MSTTKYPFGLVSDGGTEISVWVQDEPTPFPSVKSFRTGKPYIHFDGTDDHVGIPNSDSINIGSSALTISALIKLDSFPSNMTAFINKERQYEIGVDSSGQLGAAIYTVNGSWVWIYSGVKITTGKVYWVTVTYDGTYIRFYVNGRWKATKTNNTSGNIAQTDYPLRFAARGTYTDPSQASNYINIKIFEVRLWERVLKENELIYLLTHQPDSTDSTLKGWWKFDEYGSSTLKDYSQFGNDGTLYNAVWSITGGRWEVFDDATVRSWADTGVVIAGWWKLAYPMSSSDDMRLFSATEQGGFNIEKYEDEELRISVNDNGTYVLGLFEHQDVFNDLEWHFVVFIYDAINKKATAYVDAYKEAEVTLQDGLYFNPDKEYRLVFGNELVQQAPWNGWMASVYVGKPYNDDGVLIWKPEFIQQIYQAKRPFTIPPKVPIL